MVTLDRGSHFMRVMRYARPMDYVYGVGASLAGPALFVLQDRVSPSYAGKRSWASGMRMSWAIGLTGGFLLFYQRICRE